MSIPPIPALTATDLNGYRGMQTIPKGATEVIRLALLSDLDATGTYSDMEGIPFTLPGTMAYWPVALVISIGWGKTSISFVPTGRIGPSGLLLRQGRRFRGGSDKPRCRGQPRRRG